MTTQSEKIEKVVSPTGKQVRPKTTDTAKDADRNSIEKRVKKG